MAKNVNVISLKGFAPEWKPEKKAKARPLSPLQVLRMFMERACEENEELQAYLTGFDAETTVSHSCQIDDVRALDMIIDYAKQHAPALNTFEQDKVFAAMKAWTREHGVSRRQRQRIARQNAVAALQAKAAE